MDDQDFFIDFPFRAHRDYVHSASICNELAARYETCDRFQLVLKNMMNARVHFARVDAVQPGAGYLKITRNGIDEIRELREDTDFPVQTIEAYDEDSLVSKDNIEENRLTSRPRSGSTFFDRMIAANKVLINETLKPGVKLIAAKVDVTGFPGSETVFTILLKSHIGTRIFRSDILVGDQKVGDVTFYGQ